MISTFPGQPDWNAATYTFEVTGPYITRDGARKEATTTGEVPAEIAKSYDALREERR